MTVEVVGTCSRRVQVFLATEVHVIGGVRTIYCGFTAEGFERQEKQG